LIVGFAIDFIKDEYINDGTDLLKEATDLLHEIIFKPLVSDGKFSDEYVEGEKTDLINAIKSLINNKAAYAKEKCTEIMFKGHPYGSSEIGTVEEAKLATSKQVYDRYQKIIKSYPVEISFCGECDFDKLTEIFKNIIPASDARREDFPTREFLSESADEITEVTESMPVAQGKLVMGFRMDGINVSSEEDAAFRVFNELFGSSPSSKLFMNVREAMSLCYYCKSIPDMFMSVMFITSGIENENRDKAVDAILMQLENVKNGDFDVPEIEDAKRGLINAYKEMDDNSAALCNWYLSRVIVNKSDTPESAVERIKAVTKEEIVNVSRRVSLDTVFFIKGTGTNGGGEE
ncbi:MAG: insulinase family protein, partial [Clostridia bacterium]|nr:insulinase family protein [Clostridia bacterium]